MLKERYKRLNDGIHADEALIDRTLDAAEAPSATPQPRSAGLRVAIGIVCAFVLLVVAAARIVPPPKDVVASSGKTSDTEEFLPLPSPSPEDLTLTISDVTLINEHELSFILTVRGDRVDAQTMIAYSIERFIFDKCTVSVADETIPPDANQRSFQFSLEYKPGPILEQLDGTFKFDIVSYTSRNQPQKYSISPDWASMDYALQMSDEPVHPWSGEPLYHLDDTFSVTGFGLTEHEELIVQVRWPATAGYDTHCIPTLFDATADKQHTIREAFPHYADDYCYHQYTFGVRRNELQGMQLIFDAQLTEQIIAGNWPITVDLTHLTAE